MKSCFSMSGHAFDVAVHSSESFDFDEELDLLLSQSETHSHGSSSVNAYSQVHKFVYLSFDLFKSSILQFGRFQGMNDKMKRSQGDQYECVVLFLQSDVPLVEIIQENDVDLLR